MATESIADFLNLFCTATPAEVQIESLCKVINVYEGSKTHSLDRKLSSKGLFFIEVTSSQDNSRFVLTPSPEAFVEAVDDIFDRGQVCSHC